MKKLYFGVLLLSVAAFSQNINFPDPVFKFNLLTSAAFDAAGNPFDVDVNNDDEISVAEAQAVYRLTLQPAPQVITSLEGIQYFTGLRRLAAQNLNIAGSLDVSMMPHLIQLAISGNAFNSVTVTGLSELELIYIGNNQSLASLDLSGCTSLKIINIGYTSITSIDLSENINLEDFYAGGTYATIPSLDFSGLTKLKTIVLSPCGLASINLTGTIGLKTLYAANNQLTQLDVSDSPVLTDLEFQNNLVTSLDLSHQTLAISPLNASNNKLAWISFKNGFGDIGNASETNFSQNPTLQYACCDAFETYQLNNKIVTYGYSSSCIQTTYCTTDPGGYIYSIAGENRFDASGSCSGSSSPASYLKYVATFANGSQMLLFSNGTGHYDVPFLTGFASVAPLVNTSIFSVSPALVETVFPDQQSPLIQDFCLSPIGIHPDLGVSIVPLDVARPGFVSHYKIVYRNSGNVVQSGTVSFSFNDAILDVLSSVPAANVIQTGQYSFDFAGLSPFESREITIAVHVNSPTQTPPVTQGSILQFVAEISSVLADENPADNSCPLKQIVVASLDPNDKVCVEGTSVGPQYIGEYLHYVIRFENTGNFMASNVVVRDEINTLNFDPASVVPVSGSHPFRTRIIDNVVEFIFDGIDLPFEAGSNQGYVAFKVKTLPTLAVGSSVNNNANIYFDYNSAINTGMVVTQIAALQVENPNASIDMKLWPIPVQHTLNFELSQTAEILSMTIYNAIGQQLITLLHPSNRKALELDRLDAGTYFFKVTTPEGSAVQKFIKQ